MIEVKFDQKSLDEFEGMVKKSFQKVMSNPRMLNDLGKMAVDDIKFQTRRGFSIPQNKKFEPLKSSWKEKRKMLVEQKAVKTDPLYSPNRSNLTFTGKLINAITYRIKKSGMFEIFLDGIHNVTYSKDKISNQELAVYVSQIRPFIGIRDKIQDRMKKKILEYLRRSSSVFKEINE